MHRKKQDKKRKEKRKEKRREEKRRKARKKEPMKERTNERKNERTKERERERERTRKERGEWREESGERREERGERLRASAAVLSISGPNKTSKDIPTLQLVLGCGLLLVGIRSNDSYYSSEPCPYACPVQFFESGAGSETSFWFVS